ncbi:MAG TPA: acetyltransferase [Victivallales bacterium]|nr:acetyltransferase [Victivallales bacterium]
MNNKLIIFGNGEIAELAKYYFTNDSSYDVVAFVIDNEFIGDTHFCNLPVIPLDDLKSFYPPDQYQAHVALSYRKLNKIRCEKYDLMKSLNYSLASYICTKSAFWDDLSIGENCFILENQTIQPTVKIGDNVMIWSGNHLGHASIIKNHVYISSHVVICGHCIVGERTFLGVNSTVKDFTKIGHDVFIAMDASVVANVEDGGMVLGAKSQIYKADNKITKLIKHKFFN